MSCLHLHAARLHALLQARLHGQLQARFVGRTAGPERGDVPGWVLITLMTAGLVAALWSVAQDQLTALFHDALASARR